MFDCGPAHHSFEVIFHLECIDIRQTKNPSVL